MKKGSIVLIGIVVIVLIFGMAGCGQYNGINTAKVEVDNSWAKVQSAYQRRADLIPNLVATVKGAAKFETETYIGVAQARAGQLKSLTNVPADSLTPQRIDQIQKASAEQTQAMRSAINIAIEAYPQLRATESFMGLQSQLEGTENRINTERNNFNNAATAYNLKVTNMPGKLFAGMFGFKPRDLFKADEGAQNAPKVQF